MGTDRTALISDVPRLNCWKVVDGDCPAGSREADIPTALDGLGRRLFVCRCSRLVYDLYGKDGQWACRRCQGLGYPVQYVPALRDLVRIQRLRYRLKDPLPPFHGIIPPRRWRKQRLALVAELMGLEQRYLAKLRAKARAYEC